MTTYTVAFYAGKPREGVEPILTMVVEAEGGIHAQDVAKSRREVKKIVPEPTYVEATPKRRLTS